MVVERKHPTGSRDVARDAVRQQLADIAVELFVERGFEAVTIDQVAAGAGMSTRSVHRYFASKEDMVIGPFEANGEIVLELLHARPADEAPLTSLRAALVELARQGPDRPGDKAAMRLLAATPSVRARNVAKQSLWTDLLAPVIAGRLDGEHTALRAEAIVQAALAAFTVTLLRWADDPAERGLDHLLEIAFQDLTPRPRDDR